MNTLFHIHDPMCSWCWAFKPTWEKIRASVASNGLIYSSGDSTGGALVLRNVVGGLAADSDEPMPGDMQRMLQANWQRIQRTVPGTQFNFDFWASAKPRRSTYPACRAVLCAKNQSIEFEEPMITAIQHAYYLQAKNPSDSEVLIQLAADIGCDQTEFAAQLISPEIEAALQREFLLVRELGVQGFPSLVLQLGDNLFPIAVDYSSAMSVLDRISAATTV